MATERVGDAHKISMYSPDIRTNFILGDSKRSIRNDGIPKLVDMLLIGNPVKNFNLLLGLIKTWNSVCPDEIKIDIQDHLKGKPLPLLFTQICLAAVRHGAISESSDMDAFLRNKNVYRPGLEEIQACGLCEADITEASAKPAILTGSLLIEFWGLEEREVLLRPRRSGYYEGKLGIIGGHMDRMNETPAFYEAMEESDISQGLLRLARPLGVCDQVVLTGSAGNYELTRYLNMAWIINLSNFGTGKNVITDSMLKKGWRMMDYDDFYHNNLTPITISTLTMSGFLTK